MLIRQLVYTMQLDDLVRHPLNLHLNGESFLTITVEHSLSTLAKGGVQAVKYLYRRVDVLAFVS